MNSVKSNNPSLKYIKRLHKQKAKIQKFGKFEFVTKTQFLLSGYMIVIQNICFISSLISGVMIENIAILGEIYFSLK